MLKAVTNFRVPIRYKDLENMCVDDWRVLIAQGDFRTDPLHEQRVHYFLDVTSDLVIKYAFDLLCQGWYPKSDGVDSAKWAKFARDMRIFPDIHKPKRAAQVDLSFKRNVSRMEDAKSDKQKKKDAKNTMGNGANIRKLSAEYFMKALEELALLRFPKMATEPGLAMKHVVMDNIIMVPEINTRVWNEAKRLAMLQEAVRQSAAIRIQAVARRVEQMNKYRDSLRQCILLQAELRRARSAMRYRQRRQWLQNDLLYRVRWVAATNIQMIFRMHCASREFQDKLLSDHIEFMLRCRARRKKQAARRARREKAAMFKRVRTVNGCMCLQEMYRKSKGNVGDTDYSVVLRVYVPVTQRSFRFDIPDAQFRDFLNQATGTGSFSNNELTEKKNLALVCDRLMCRIIEGQPIIYISRRSVGERGIQVARKGVNVPGGGRVIVTCFWANDEVVFQTYDTRNCGPMRTSMTIVLLRQWLTDEIIWERRREKREINSKRGEARKLLKRKTLGLDVDEIEVEWATDYLAKTGGDREMGIAAFVLDEKALSESSAGSGQQDNATKEAEDGRRLAKDSQEEDLGDFFGEDEETMARMVAKAEAEAAKHEEEMKQKAKDESKNEDLTQNAVRRYTNNFGGSVRPVPFI